MKILLAFDMDNTLVKTDVKVFEMAINYCKVHGKKFELNELIECRDRKGDYNKLSESTKEIIYKEVIEKRVYMDYAEESDIVENHFGGYLKVLKKMYPEVKTAICTHRGDNREARLSTHNWLDKRDLMEEFDAIYSISHKHNSDKIAYLKEKNEGYFVLLVDDNPFGSSSKVREKCENVLVYDGLVSLPCHENQNKFVDMSDVIMKIAELTGA